jgi:ribose transport system substrate-binding protein
LVALSGCASGPTHSAAEKYYLVSTNLGLPYWKAATSGFYKAARELNVQGEAIGPENFDPEAQAEALRGVINGENPPDGLLVGVADAALLGPIINEAIGKGIPVITIDSDAPESNRLTFIGTNNYQAGVMGGEILAEQLDGKGTVVVYTLEGQQNTAERLQGYRNVLEGTEIEIVRVINDKGDGSLAFDITGKLIEEMNPIPDAFVCLESASCGEVADVLDRNNIEGKILVAMDTEPGTLKWIKDGVIVATIAQKPYTMAYFGMRMLGNLKLFPVEGMSEDHAIDPRAAVPNFIDTGALVLDKNNVDQFETVEVAQ